MTSSPGPIPAASSDRCSALVPVFTPMPCAACWKVANSRSKAATSLPSVNWQRLENAANGGIDFVLDAEVLRLQVDERNHAIFSSA